MRTVYNSATSPILARKKPVSEWLTVSQKINAFLCE